MRFARVLRRLFVAPHPPPPPRRELRAMMHQHLRACFTTFTAGGVVGAHSLVAKAQATPTTPSFSPMRTRTSPRALGRARALSARIVRAGHPPPIHAESECMI